MLPNGPVIRLEHFACDAVRLWSTLVVYRAQLGASGVMFKVAKGCGHNRYGEPAWPNEIFYVFPVVICGVSAPSIALGAAEPCRGRLLCNSFKTPIEIVPEWYFLAAFNDLRTIDDKSVGLGTLVGFALRAALSPFMENPVASQNPFRRFPAVSSFLYFFGHLPVATIGAGASIHAAFPSA